MVRLEPALTVPQPAHTVMPRFFENSEVPVMLAQSVFIDDHRGSIVAVLALALLAVSGTPAWAQRAYDRVPIVKEGTTIKISPHVYVIPDENTRGVPNVGIVVGSRATL